MEDDPHIQALVHVLLMRFGEYDTILVMSVTKPFRTRIQELKRQYDTLRFGKEVLLASLDEAEVAEAVYNSNAIEGSTLRLTEAERILLGQRVSRNITAREILETKNLARIIAYLRNTSQGRNVDKGFMCQLHQLLVGGISDQAAGRFRAKGENLRVDTRIAPAPERVEPLLEATLIDYTSDQQTYFIEKIAQFHLAFETIQPFSDGNGQMGRILVNAQLEQFGFPELIIRERDRREYDRAFREYAETKKRDVMERVLVMGVMESLQKRIAYLNGEAVVILAEYINVRRLSAPALTNAARRQKIPAFRERGVWKIVDSYVYDGRGVKVDRAAKPEPGQRRRIR